MSIGEADVSSRAFNMVEESIRQIDVAIKNGRFKKNELEAISLFAGILKRTTDDLLLRIDNGKKQPSPKESDNE